MAARKRSLTLTDETWGDRVHRAYRYARDELNLGRDPKTGQATFSYLAIAEKLRAAGIDTSDQALMRLEREPAIPTRMRQRQVAYFALMAYGFDPAEFGLTSDNVNLVGFDLPKIKRALTPTFRWSVDFVTRKSQVRGGVRHAA